MSSSARRVVALVPGGERIATALVRRVRRVPPGPLAEVADALEAANARIVALATSLEASHERLRPLEDRTALIEMHLPGLLDALSISEGQSRRLVRDLTDLAAHIDRIDQIITGPRDALDSMGAAVAELWERVRVVRAEILNEVRYSAAKSAAAAGPEPVVEVRDPEGFDRARREGLRLNIGCGHLALDGFVNLDARDLPTVDVIAPVDAIPLAPGEAQEIFSAHVLEHFPEQRLRRHLMPYWVSLLEPGGEFRAVVPDGAAMSRAFAAGDIPFEVLRSVVLGGQEYEGDSHLSMFDVDSLSDVFSAAGLVGITVEAVGRLNDNCLELQLVGTRPIS